MPIWPFGRSRAEEDAEKLLQAVIAASRQPAFFGEGKVPDTLEGRFELVVLHAGLALIRLRDEPGADPLAQAFTDKLFRYFDSGLREAGVSDTAVPRRMRRLAGSFYGRLAAYAEALQTPVELERALARNMWRAETHPYAAALAAYAGRAAAAQAEAPFAALFEPAGWPPR